MMALFFAAVYVPVMRSEQAHLTALFGKEYSDYARAVPLLLTCGIFPHVSRPAASFTNEHGVFRRGTATGILQTIFTGSSCIPLVQARVIASQMRCGDACTAPLALRESLLRGGPAADIDQTTIARIRAIPLFGTRTNDHSWFDGRTERSVQVPTGKRERKPDEEAEEHADNGLCVDFHIPIIIPK